MPGHLYTPRMHTKSFVPPQASIDNFNLVWEYAGCTKEEARYEKQRILRDFDEADLCYRLMANRIRAEKQNENSVKKSCK